MRIKYFNNQIPTEFKLNKISKGDWIDLRVDRVELVNSNGVGVPMAWDSKDGFCLESGKTYNLKLGVAMELPKGTEAWVLPRSSSFKNYGFILTNSMGIIDNSYCGDGDEWNIMVHCLRTSRVERYDRVCQFRVADNMERYDFEEVEHLGNSNRGGYGSTGLK
ncbi:MAG: dUTP diphosphatase [Cetobacterium sp.]